MLALAFSLHTNTLRILGLFRMKHFFKAHRIVVLAISWFSLNGGNAAEIADAEQSLADPTDVVLVDGFDEHRFGRLLPSVGPTPEYHFVSEAIQTGPWSVTAYSSSVGAQSGWRVTQGESRKSLVQRYRNKEAHWHPLVVTGDRLWRDYVVRVSLLPSTSERRCGVTVRTRNDRRYIFVGFDRDLAVITRVRHETEFRKPGETILAQAPASRSTDQTTEIRVRVVGNEISASVGGVMIAATADDDRDGGVGLLSDLPATFMTAEVRCSIQDFEQMQAERNATRAEIAEIARELPKPKLWRTIMTEDTGADRNYRFGDLDGDGRTDILMGQIEHHGPRDSNSELSCLTAINLDGEILWQIGEPDRYRHHLTNDVGFQVYDFDGDGKCEVVYCKDMQIVIADGSTGKKLRSAPTPENPNRTPPANRFPRILGDSIVLADLSGTGHSTDILIKDRYRGLWAFNSQLKSLWFVECNTGHYPFPIDIDGDGRDEVAVGYSMVDSDGTVLWSRDNDFADHADSVAVVDLQGDGSREVLWAGSDEGFVLLNDQGVPRLHHRIGHAQNLTIAELRPELPGLEIAVMNFWRNQGIMHILDANGQILGDYEPRCEHGSAIAPVNWTGKAAELLLVNPDPEYGGLYDGEGRCVMQLPADGHPTRVYDAIDLTGDARDEIIVWDSQEIWIYTQDDGETKIEPEAITLRQRNGRHNESNYRARVSIPR